MTDIEVARSIVQKTNDLLLARYKTAGIFNSKIKADGTLVTETDFLANELVTTELQKYFPDDAIVSEEADQIAGVSENVWYVDPLDGTSNFSHGLHEFATCLARLKSGVITHGLIGLPASNEIVWAEAGGPVFLNDRPIAIAQGARRTKKSYVVMSRGSKPEATQQFMRIFQNIDFATMRIRLFGCAGMELSNIALGHIDGYVGTSVHPWDVLAGILLVRAAGGRATNFEGKDWVLGDTNLIVSNGLIHDELLDLVRRAG